MRLNTIINRYLLLELLPPFGLNIFFFSFIFLVTEILEITNMVVNYHVSLFSFLLLLLYSMPFFLTFIIPMSVMMAVLLTFLRMSQDNETVALKACGMNPHRYLVPVFTFCLTGWLLTTLITAVVQPWSKRAYYQLSVKLAQSHADAVIKERTFIDSFDGMTLYINKINLTDRSLTDVFIEDQRNKAVNNIIVAPKGRMILEVQKNIIRLRLFNGAINQVSLTDHAAHVISFETYEMNLDIKSILSKSMGARRPMEEMTINELNRYIRSTARGSIRRHKALMRLHEKFALPMACFVLGLVAIPMGMQSRPGRRSTGALIGIAIILGYYILLSVGWSLGESGTLPPVAGMWAPNIIVGGVGIWLYSRMLQDRAVRWSRVLGALNPKRFGGEKKRKSAP